MAQSRFTGVCDQLGAEYEDGTGQPMNMDGALLYEGPCEYLVVTKNPAQSMPTQAERDGPLELPPSGDDARPQVPPCVDHDPTVAPSVAPTLLSDTSVALVREWIAAGAPND